MNTHSVDANSPLFRPVFTAGTAVGWSPFFNRPAVSVMHGGAISRSELSPATARAAEKRIMERKALRAEPRNLMIDLSRDDEEREEQEKPKIVSSQFICQFMTSIYV